MREKRLAAHDTALSEAMTPRKKSAWACGEALAQALAEALVKGERRGLRAWACGEALTEALSEALVKGERRGLHEVQRGLVALELGDTERALRYRLEMDAPPALREAFAHVFDAQDAVRTPEIGGAWRDTVMVARGQSEEVFACLEGGPPELAPGVGAQLATLGTAIVRERGEHGLVTCAPESGAIEDARTGTNVVEHAASREGVVGELGGERLARSARETFAMGNEQAKEAAHKRPEKLRERLLDAHNEVGAPVDAHWSREPAPTRVANAVRARGIRVAEAVALERAASGRCLDAHHRSGVAQVGEARLEAAGAEDTAERERTVRCARTALFAQGHAREATGGAPAGAPFSGEVGGLADAVREAGKGQGRGGIGYVAVERFERALGQIAGDTGWHATTVCAALEDGAKATARCEARERNARGQKGRRRREGCGR